MQPRPMTKRREREGADLYEGIGWIRRRRSAEGSANASNQFGDPERPDEIIIRACLERSDDLGLCRPAGDHQDGNMRALPDGSADLDAGRVGERDVEDDDVE